MTFATQLAGQFTAMSAIYDPVAVGQALSWAQSFIEGYCNRTTFDLVTNDVAFVDPMRYNTALLPSIPVVNVDSVLALLPPQANYIPSLSAIPSNTGGTFPAGQYYWVVTAQMVWGAESSPSNEVTATFTGSTSSIALSWAQVPQAVGYKVYRGYLATAENVLVTSIGSGSTTTYTDTGTAGTGNVPPSGPVWTPIANYRFVSETGLLYDATGLPGSRSTMLPSWPTLPGSLQVTYDHGYATVPMALINAGCRFAQQYLENPALLLSRDVGGVNDRFAGNTGGVGIVINALDSRILDRYTLTAVA